MVRAAAARGETDAVSLRRKVTTLDAMKARFAAEPGFELPADGSRVLDPAGRWAFAMDADGHLLAGAADAAALDWSRVRVRGDRCLFADDGTTLWIRGADEWNVSWKTFDLPRRIALQSFVEDTGKPRPAT